MTLGGRITSVEKQLEDLHELIKATTGLPGDFPNDAEVPLLKFSQVYEPSAKDNFGELNKVLTGTCTTSTLRWATGSLRSSASSQCGTVGPTT